MADVEIDNPRFKVRLMDGTELDVQTESPDLAYYDLSAYRNKWPPPQQGAFWWSHYLVYSKLKRTGQLNGSGPVPKFEEWLGTVSRVANLDADGNPVTVAQAAFPTQEGPEQD